MFDHLPPIDGDLRTGLVKLGAGLLGFILSGPSMAIHRLAVAEADRFPALGRIFYETGPLRGQERLEAYFSTLIDAGQLKPCDPGVAARRFKDLVLSDVYSRRLWGVLGDLTPAELNAHAAESTDIFLAAFGAAR